MTPNSSNLKTNRRHINYVFRAIYAHQYNSHGGAISTDGTAVAVYVDAVICHAILYIQIVSVDIVCVFKIQKIRQFAASIGCRKAKTFEAPDPLAGGPVPGSR